MRCLGIPNSNAFHEVTVIKVRRSMGKECGGEATAQGQCASLTVGE